MDKDSITFRPEQEPSPPTWWVWFDRLLEEWFYSDTSLELEPALALQLEKEKTTIYEVQAHTGAQAIEMICPGYRDDRRADPVSTPLPKPPPGLN